jgi:hypothetical protein
MLEISRVDMHTLVQDDLGECVADELVPVPDYGKLEVRDPRWFKGDIFIRCGGDLATNLTRAEVVDVDNCDVYVRKLSVGEVYSVKVTH